MSRLRAKAAVVSGGHTIPLCPQIAAALGHDGYAAVVYQQLLFLQHGRTELHDWVPLPRTAAAFKVEELMSDDTLAKKVKKLLDYGVIEGGEKRGRRTLYRVLPQALERLVRGQFPEFVAFDPWEICGIAIPQSADEPSAMERDNGRSLFVRAQEEVDARSEEAKEENDNDKHVGSEKRKEDNSAGTVWKSQKERKCSRCPGLILKGDDLVYDR